MSKDGIDALSELLDRKLDPIKKDMEFVKQNIEDLTGMTKEILENMITQSELKRLEKRVENLEQN